MNLKLLAAAFSLAAAPVLAQDTMIDLTATGDAAAGESAFRQCATCHVVTDPAGNTLAGRAARTGPNLYGVAGRVAGSIEGIPLFRLDDSGRRAGAGLGRG